MSVTFSVEGTDTSLVDPNFHNTGARRVLETLGVVGDWEDICLDSMDGRDFLGRLLIALAIAPEDEGMPSYHQAPDQPGAQWIECGRPAGDLQRRLTDLLPIAQTAAERRVKVLWG